MPEIIPFVSVTHTITKTKEGWQVTFNITKDGIDGHSLEPFDLEKAIDDFEFSLDVQMGKKIFHYYDRHPDERPPTS